MKQQLNELEIVEAVLHNRLHVHGCGDMGTTLSATQTTSNKAVGLRFYGEDVMLTTKDIMKKEVTVLIPRTNFFFIKVRQSGENNSKS